jgi:hypothetical protein
MNTLTPETSVMEYTPEEMHNQVQRVQRVMEMVMKEGEHYGTIPGCGPKPALLKAGAEKLCFAFRMAPKYEIILTPLTGGHREYQIVCELRHIVTNQLLGSGVGCCSTMESKYRYRGAKTADEMTDVQVPKAYWDARNAKADAPTLLAILAKAVGEPGRYGTKKNDADQWMITRKGERTENKEENPDIADTFNTVLKMAKKRAHVDAVLTATAASDIFAQDIEENPEMYGGRNPEPAKQEAARADEKTETQVIEAVVVGVYENDDKALAAEGWRGIDLGENRIVETKDAATIKKAQGLAGTGVVALFEIEWITGKEWPRLKAIADKT